jgi:tellurite resistance protein
MKNPSKSASNLKELIIHAIQDLEVTPDEYQKIMDCAQDDGHIDNEEKALLSQFQEMIINGTIKRVKG